MGFNTMLFPVSGAGVILLIALFQVGSAHAHLADELEVELQSLASLRSDLAHAGHLIEEYAATGRETARAELEILRRSVDRDLELTGDFDEPEEVRLGEAATDEWEAAKRLMARVFTAPPGTGVAAAVAAVEHFHEAETQIARLDDASRAELQTTAEAAARTSRLVVALALIIGACATCMNIVLVRRLLNATFRPLRHLTEGVRRFSADDLTHRIEPMGDLEFQAVGESFNAMAHRLEETFASLEHQAFHDSLTGLPNRAGLLRDLERTHADERTIVLFDIDDFKAVNDGLGHEAGDAALTQVAQRLARGVRPGDYLARLGGDEFVVVLDGLPLDAAVARAERIAEQISHAAEIAGRSVVLHASAGIAPVHTGDDATDALRRADVALYVAKEDGKRCVRVFRPDMLRDVEGHLEMATDLREALDRGEISVHYQPTVSIGSGEVHGVEALLRWHHPVRGVVPPCAFIPLAEKTGQIHGLGRFVLDAACHQAQAWQQLSGLEDLSVNVNVSASQLLAAEIVDDVAGALQRSGLAPACLTLEVTESVLADPKAVARVHELKALGVGIALDDFGTGYSSLSYLQHLPIDVLKIDKSFIDDIDRRADRAVLASTIVQLGRSLGLLTVAEGVEREDQLRILEAVGCDLVQGFLLARPQPPVQAQLRLLALAASGTATTQPPGDGRVRVTVGPLDVVAAREWLHHANWVLDEVERGQLLAGEVPHAVLAVMRDYVDRWTVAAMDPDAFIWVADEDVELLGIMMDRWRGLSAALVEAVRAGTVQMSLEAAAFSREVAHSILAALAAHRDHGRNTSAAVLAYQWPNRAGSEPISAPR